MDANSKKNLVGLSAAISTAISIFLWGWYAMLPSMDKIDQPMNEMEMTFQEVTIK